MTKIAFLDTETTSLRPDRRVWDIGLIVRDDTGRETERQWFIDVDDLDLGNADLTSLKIGKFYQRHPDMNCGVIADAWPAEEALRQVEQHTRGAIIVGAVPNFDTEAIGDAARRHGIAPSWHYHLVDVETLAAGALKLLPPWDFDAVLAAYRLKYDKADRHTALGDARMARDLYDAVMAGTELREAHQ